MSKKTHFGKPINWPTVVAYLLLIISIVQISCTLMDHIKDYGKIKKLEARIEALK